MKKIQLLLPVWVLMIAVFLTLPRFSAEGYSILRHTTSQLGAQSTPNAWVMNAVFCLLGAACIIEGWLHLRKYWFQKVIITVFGLSLVLTAVFRHAPIIETLHYSVWHDQLHSVFATIVGFSFTLFAVSAAFIHGRWSRRILALLAAANATVLTMLIFVSTDYSGLWQRLMFVLSFAWLAVLFWGLKKDNTWCTESI